MEVKKKKRNWFACVLKNVRLINNSSGGVYYKDNSAQVEGVGRRIKFLLHLLATDLNE